MSRYSLESIDQAILDMRNKVKIPLITQGNQLIESLKSANAGLSGESNGLDFDQKIAEVQQVVNKFGDNMEKNLEQLEAAAREEYLGHEAASTKMANALDNLH